MKWLSTEEMYVFSNWKHSKMHKTIRPVNIIKINNVRDTIITLSWAHSETCYFMY